MLCRAIGFKPLQQYYGLGAGAALLFTTGQMAPTGSDAGTVMPLLEPLVNLSGPK